MRLHGLSRAHEVGERECPLESCCEAPAVCCKNGEQQRVYSAARSSCGAGRGGRSSRQVEQRSMPLATCLTLTALLTVFAWWSAAEQHWREGREEAEEAGRPSDADQERVGGADLPATAPAGPGQAGLDVPTVRVLNSVIPLCTSTAVRAPTLLQLHSRRRLLPATATHCTSKHSLCTTGPVTNCCPVTGPAAALLRSSRHKPVGVRCGRLHRSHAGARPSLSSRSPGCVLALPCLTPLPSTGKLICPCVPCRF
jgi:hypothetical protein